MQNNFTEATTLPQNIVTVDPVAHIEYAQHTDKAKAKAVRLYLKTGSLRHVSDVMGISYSTLQSWKYRTNWWGELTKRFQEEADRKLSARMEEVVQKAVQQIEDRIENGDKILDSKTGEVINVPVKMRDLTAATKTLSERTDVLIGRATKDSIAKEQMQDKLAKLAKEFANFTKNKSEAFDLVEQESGVFELAEDEGE